MEENIYFENKKDDEEKKIETTNITPIIENTTINDDKDEFVKSLPSWDLEPPFEEIRRN